MANPAYQYVTVTGNGTPIVLDHFQVPFSLAWAVEFASGATCTYNVQVTYDDVNDASWTPVWWSLFGSNQTTGVAGGITSSTMATGGTPNGTAPGPIRAIRIAVTAISGTVRLAVLQGINQRGG